MVRGRLSDLPVLPSAMAMACRFAVALPCFALVFAYCFPSWNSLMLVATISLLAPRFNGMGYILRGPLHAPLDLRLRRYRGAAKVDLGILMGDFR